MIAKEITYSMDAKMKLKKGVDKLANAVKVTLGPSGRNVLLERQYTQPHITKDGVTVARDIILEDPIENMGATMVKSVASKTNDLAGDGTTTATVLAQAMFNEGYQLVATGSNPMFMKKGMDLYVKEVSDILKKISTKIDYSSKELNQIATISANGDVEIGKHIADAINVVKSDGEVTIEDARGVMTEIDIVQGMQFDKGYESPYFVTDIDKMEAVYEDAYILLYDGKIENINDIVPLLESLKRINKPLLIVTSTIIGDALQTIILNRVKAQMPIVVVTAPSFGDNRKDIMEDISYVIGGRVISPELDDNLNDITFDDLGRASKIVVNQKSTLIIDGKGTMIDERVKSIKTKLENSELNDYDKNNLKSRLAKLTGGVAVIKVGAASDVELKEKKDRYIDALSATKAAMEEGVVPGGGIALLLAQMILEEKYGKFDMDDVSLGMRLVNDAISAPLRNIITNGGYSYDVIFNNIKDKFSKTKNKLEFNYGFDALVGTYGNMYKLGIIDPTKVTRVALENAVSVSSMLLTTECVVNDIPKEEKPLMPNQLM